VSRAEGCRFECSFYTVFTDAGRGEGEAVVGAGVHIRYVLMRCHETGEHGERRLGYKYIFCLFVNNKECVV
jgi:hypothetical protein